MAKVPSGGVVWAPVAVVANPYAASGITALAAALGIAPLALALVAPLRREAKAPGR